MESVHVRGTMSSLWPGKEIPAAGEELAALPSGRGGGGTGDAELIKPPAERGATFRNLTHVALERPCDRQAVSHTPGFQFPANSVFHVSLALTFMERDERLFLSLPWDQRK